MTLILKRSLFNVRCAPAGVQINSHLNHIYSFTMDTHWIKLKTSKFLLIIDHSKLILSSRKKNPISTHGVTLYIIKKNIQINVTCMIISNMYLIS